MSGCYAGAVCFLEDGAGEAVFKGSVEGESESQPKTKAGGLGGDVILE